MLLALDTSAGEIDFEVVAQYAADPANAPSWYVNIDSMQWHSELRVAVGSRTTFTAHFLGRELTYTYQIVEHIPDRRLVMRTTEGPFPMETTYTWTDVGDGSTRMTLRNRGEPSGFTSIVAPMMAAAMRRRTARILTGSATSARPTPDPLPDRCGVAGRDVACPCPPRPGSGDCRSELAVVGSSTGAQVRGVR